MPSPRAWDKSPRALISFAFIVVSFVDLIFTTISDTIGEMLDTVHPGLSQYTFVVEVVIIGAVVVLIIF